MMMEHVISRASGIDSLLCQSNCREAEAGLQTGVAGSEIQLNEVNDLADKRDRRPTARGSFSTVNTSAIDLYKGARNRDITGGRVISVKTVDRRGVCGNRALTTGGWEDQEEHGRGIQHSNSYKHQDAFSISIMLEDERLVAPLHKSREQQIRFDCEGHIILLRGVNGELCDVDQIVQMSSVGLASVACGNTAVVDGFNRIAVSSMMHEGAEHSDGLNQIVLSSTMYGAVKGSLPLARRAKEQGINDTLPIAVRMLSVLKRHAQRRCIDQGSRAIGWELLLLPGRIYERCLSRRSCFLQDMSMGGAVTTCHTLPAGRCCPSQKMATGCCHLSDEVLTGGVLIRCHTPPFGRYCWARSMFMGSTLIREPWLFSRCACGKVIDQVLYIASGRSVDQVPHGVVKRSLPLVRLAEERGIDDTLSIAVRMLLLSNRHARGRHIDRVLRASSWERLLLSGRVDGRYFSRRHCFLQGMSTSGASINCHTLPARRCCYSQETAAGRYHLLQAMPVEGISIWCHTLPLGRYSCAQGMFKSSALIRKLRLFSRNACGKGVDQVLSIASGRHGGHVSHDAAKRLLPLARRAEERGIDEALSTAVRILVSKRHTRGQCIDQVLQAFGWELLPLTGRAYGRCFSRRSCLLQDMSKGPQLCAWVESLPSRGPRACRRGLAAHNTIACLQHQVHRLCWGQLYRAFLCRRVAGLVQRTARFCFKLSRFILGR